MTVSEDIEMGKGYWKFNVSLLKDKTYTDHIKTIIQQIIRDLEHGNWENAGDWREYLKLLLQRKREQKTQLCH